MRIGHNLLSINVNNSLGISMKKRDNIIKKLSSGYRINCAADDAAGLAISEKMRSQIRSLGQASRNAQDGISLIQTAEGALGEVHSMLQRIHELSIQAANDTYAEDDRNTIQKEINELVKEIDKTATSTEFNGMKLLDGTKAKIATSNSPLAEASESSMTLHDLLNSPTKNLNLIYVNQTDDYVTTKSGVGGATLSGYTNLKNVLQAEIVPQAVTSVLRAFSPAFNYLSSSSIGIGLKLYNDTSTTTLAAVSVGYALYGSNVDDTMLTYQLSVNMASLAYDGSGNLTNASRSALETTIVHEMVHGFMDEAMTNGMIGASNGVYDTRYTGAQSNYTRSANSYPSWFKEGMAQSAAGGYANCNDWVNSGLGITTSTSQANITNVVTNINNSLTSGSTSSKYGTGYLACMYLGYLASGGSNITAADISNGLGKVLSDIISGKSLDTVISERTGGKYASVSDFESKFGDVSSSSFIYRLTQVVGSTGNGGLATGNLSDSDLLPNTPITTSLFTLDTTNDTVKNIYPSDVNVLSGGGRSTGGTAPVGDYTSTISGGGTGPVINPGSTIDLSNLGSIAGISYNSATNVLTITDSGNYTLTGLNTTGVRVVVNSGVNANITLNNSSINTSTGSGISLEGNANVTLNLVGNNSVISSKHGAAGIRVTTGATLTIQGSGTLDAESIYDGMIDTGAGIGGGYGEAGGNIIINEGNIAVKSKLNGAGIGGGDHGSGGNIAINGGNITVDAGDDGDPSGFAGGGAGIGGGYYGSGGVIAITGGNITAKGGANAAGIGGGCFGEGGNITITGGTITAEGGNGGDGNGGAGIGGGLRRAGGTVNIDGTGVIVKATGGGASANIGGGAPTFTGDPPVSGGTVTKTTGIIFEGTSGGIYGDITLNGPLNCDGKTLTVKGGATLTVLNGGTITNHGAFTNNGRIENHGVIGNVSGPGITHHYATGVLKHIKEPTTATIGKSLADSIAAFSPSTITVAYNGTTRTLTGKWSVTDTDGNPITDLSGTIVGDIDKYIYTVTFTSEDGIYFDPLNMALYNSEKSSSQALNYETISDPYLSVSGPGGGGSTLTYSYVVASAPPAIPPVVPPITPPVIPPVVPPEAETGGIVILLGENRNHTMNITIESIKAQDLGIDNLSVLTHHDAERVMDASYKAINKVSEIRGNLGACQNRLEHSISSINNTEENLQDAESRIRDMDMAKGIMDYSKYQIIIQVEQAMLVQANQSSKHVIDLLS